MSEKTQFELLWNKIKERAEKLVNPVTYSAYIEGLEPVDVINKKIVLRASTEMVAGVVTKNTEKLREAIVSAEIGLTDFALVVEGSETYSIDDATDLTDTPDVALDKRFTFDSFVVGSSNKFVFAAAKSVAEDPGAEGFNPLYIYGGTGLGKTHLMQAIANELAQKKPSLKVIYTTSEKFLNEYVDSMFAKKGAGRDEESRFRNKYRSVDVLLIDDIQFWAGKYGVQEAFFHTFNELFGQHKQIVISSDCPAKELTTLEERLRTRFEGGLIADIQPPDVETKVAILKRKALEKKYLVPDDVLPIAEIPVGEMIHCVELYPGKGAQLVRSAGTAAQLMAKVAILKRKALEKKYIVPDDVLAFLVKNSDNNVRTLEGRLNTVIFASKLHEEPISLKLASLALQEAINVEESAEATPETIIRATCAHFNVTKQELLGKNKRQELVRARQICTYLMCDMLALPLVSVGKEMGGRDHATVIYSRDKVIELMRVSDSIAKDVSDIKSAVLKQ